MRAEVGSTDDRPDLEEVRLYLAAIVRSGPVRLRVRLALQALAIGLVAGLAVFVYLNKGLMPAYAEPWWPLGIVLVTGAFARLLVPHLRSSIAVLIGAFFVGLAVHVIAWTLPLWLLEYPVRVRDLLLPGYVGRALLGAVVIYPTTFVVGYLLGLIVDVYLYN